MTARRFVYDDLRPIALPSMNRISHRPTVQIQELVALSYGLHPRLMTAQLPGQRHVSRARQIAMYLTRTMTKRSYPSIGNAFHRDHSTVVHAVNRIEHECLVDPILRADIAALRMALLG